MKMQSFALVGILSMFILTGCDDGDDNGPREDPPPAGAPFCQESCTDESDCLSGFTCDLGRCVSTAASTECTTNEECRALFSGWTTGCTDDASCLSGFGVCIVVGGTNYCTTEKSGTCPTGEEVVADKVEGGTVSVCGNATALCAELGGTDICFDPECATDLDCTGVSTKCYGALYCGCKDNSECQLVRDGGTVCLADGSCGCADASECTGANEDICRDGQCGCSTAAACVDTLVHPNTTWVCER